MKLGLIGNSIKRSKAPKLHELAGSLAGIHVAYEKLVPPDLGLDFGRVFEDCRAGGFRGVNITHPYKEQVTHLVDCDPLSAQVGAVNTVVFGDDRPVGYNTDCSGFMAAYRDTYADMNPGRVAVIGAGGAGRAIAFALCALNARAISLAETDPSKANGLAARLKSLYPDIEVIVEDVIAAAEGADGLVNATPIGMTERPGSAIPPDVIGPQRWAFDAVYTPLETEFLSHARGAGLAVMNGFELFLQQGIQAFEIFTRCKADVIALRRQLQDTSFSNAQK